MSKTSRKTKKPASPPQAGSTESESPDARGEPTSTPVREIDHSQPYGVTLRPGRQAPSSGAGGAKKG